MIITGASSGLGKATVDAIANGGEYGKWHIVMAVRDIEKAKEARARCLLLPRLCDPASLLLPVAGRSP